MRQVLKFCEANRDGRESFRNTLRELAEELTGIEDPNYLGDVLQQVKERFEQSKILNLNRIREHFSQVQPLLIYFGLPLAGKVLDSITGTHDSLGQVAGLGVAGIAALADVAKTGRREWVSKEGTYYCKLKREFTSMNPIPRNMRRLDRMMEEFIND